jgi:hypothetical protein
MRTRHGDYICFIVQQQQNNIFTSIFFALRGNVVQCLSHCLVCISSAPSVRLFDGNRIAEL